MNNDKTRQGSDIQQDRQDRSRQQHQTSQNAGQQGSQQRSGQQQQPGQQRGQQGGDAGQRSGQQEQPPTRAGQQGGDLRDDAQDVSRQR